MFQLQGYQDRTKLELATEVRNKPLPKSIVNTPIRSNLLERTDHVVIRDSRNMQYQSQSKMPAKKERLPEWTEIKNDKV